MYRTHLHGAEHVTQVRGNGRKAASVHRQDHGVAQHERRDAARTTHRWNGRIQRSAEQEEGRICRASADVVRQARPREAATHVRKAQQPHEPGRRTRRHHPGKHLLDHCRRLTQHADTGSDVHAEHHPQQPELWRTHRHAHLDVIRICAALRCRSGARPLRRRQPHRGHAEHHEHQVDHAERCEGGCNARAGGGAKMLHQPHREWRRDHRSATEPHDRQPGGHAGPVREPLDEGGHR